MIVRIIARRRYLRGLADLERHDLDALLSQFADPCRFIFISSNTPMGANLHSKEAVRRWFERLHRLLPDPRFDVKELVISGWPWDIRLAARVVIRSTVAGKPYANNFAQFIRLRMGRVVSDYVIEDTQRFEQACATLIALGVKEAGAEPIRDAG
ncbi:MAG: nuclear transport factor 2 family protein [Chloroflexota bacterium]|nr:nuclear transport factor 2 family protein [Chloroflexota bacterium]